MDAPKLQRAEFYVGTSSSYSGKAVLGLLWNLKCHYRAHKNPQQDIGLIQLNSILILRPVSSEIHLSVFCLRLLQTKASSVYRHSPQYSKNVKFINNPGRQSRIKHC